VVVLAIFATVVARGLLPGVVVGLVLAVVMFAVNYGRVEQVSEVAFGETYHSNVDRPLAEREQLRSLSGRVQVLRVHGFVFFGTVSGLLERIRKRVEQAELRFLVIDLRRVAGVDSSAVVSFRKIAQLAQASDVELVLTAAPDKVRRQLEHGGVMPAEGVVRFEPDLDRGLQRCEDVLLEDVEASAPPADVLVGLPPRLWDHFERVSLREGATLIGQGDEPDDVFVLESGRLRVELTTPEGTQMRLSTVLPGVIVGEIGLYTAAPRTADVVAETSSVVLRISRVSIERLEADEPELAAALHRWFATTLAQRLTGMTQAFDTLLD
jgi:SulP family sulfate permease